MRWTQGNELTVVGDSLAAATLADLKLSSEESKGNSSKMRDSISGCFRSSSKPGPVRSCRNMFSGSSPLLSIVIGTSRSGRLDANAVATTQQKKSWLIC